MREDSARQELFRRIKAEVRGSDQYLLVGIDVAKDRHHAFFGTPNGKVLCKNLVFDNDRVGFEALRSRATSLQAMHGLPEVVYGLEPTASYHKPLAEYLIGCDETVVYVSNVAVKRNRELLDGRWDKHDKKDAANVADLVGQGKCLYYDVPRDELRELRSLLACRMRLKKQEHSLRMRLRNYLVAQYFPELDGIYLKRGEPDDLLLSIAEHCLDPQKIARMSYDGFLKLVVRRKIRIEKEKRLRAVWEAAGGSVGCVVPAAAAWEAGQVVAQLRTLREMVRENEQLMRGAAQRFPEYACLLSIPGFGPVVSSMVLGAVGEARRFQDRRQVLRLAGLDLSASRSGKKSDGVAPVISKQGKAALRYALVQAATIASNANPVISRYFGGLVKGREVERGIIMKMKVKLAAKLLVIAWTLMKHRQPFNPACFAA